MDKHWKLLSESDGPKHHFLNLYHQRYEKVATKDEIDVLVVSSGDAANVIPITKNLEVILVKQYRFGIQEETLEIPGGLIEGGEDQLVGIKRELSEETGYTTDEWGYLGTLPFNPVYHKNYIHHYIAENVELTDDTSFDLGEQIEIVKLPLPQVIHKVKRGQLSHPHTISAFMLAFDRLQTLMA